MKKVPLSKMILNTLGNCVLILQKTINMKCGSMMIMVIPGLQARGSKLKVHMIMSFSKII